MKFTQGHANIEWIRAASAASAASATAWTLARWAQSPVGRPWHGVMQPFGEPAVLAVQLLGAMWLAAILGTLPGPTPTRRWIGAALWTLLAWCTLAIMSQPSHTLGQLITAVPAQLQRLLWILVWTVPAWALVGPAQRVLDWGADPAARAAASVRRCALAIALAFVIPALYAAHRAEQLERATERLVAQHRSWDAWLTSGRWTELQPDSELAAQRHHALTVMVAQLAGSVEQPLAPSAPIDDRLQRARDLASLGRDDAASEMLDDVARQLQLDDALAHLAEPADELPWPPELIVAGREVLRLRADLGARQARWSDAAQACEAALKFCRRLPDSADRRPSELRLVDAAADHWRRAGQYTRAHSILNDAQTLDPGNAAYTVMLADHYRLGGRAYLAGELYARALAGAEGGSGSGADSQAWAGRAVAGLAELERTTPFCAWSGWRHAGDAHSRPPATIKR